MKGDANQAILYLMVVPVNLFASNRHSMRTMIKPPLNLKNDN
jgi:hypothetical protein